MTAPGDIALGSLSVTPPSAGDVVVDVARSAISTGTENLFWTGRMPTFPGMGYPLVPGYEAVGEVVEAGADAGVRIGTRVFVPGASCYTDAHGLFGASARRLVTSASRVTPVDAALGADGALLALAATAYRAVAGDDARHPDLIVGHGVLGRLMARIAVATGAAPTVWEVNPARATGAQGYDVITPDSDARKDYGTIVDASGRGDLLNDWIGRLTKGGEIVLAGFYAARPALPSRPRSCARRACASAPNGQPADMAATARLVHDGTLSLAGLITHTAPAPRCGHRLSDGVRRSRLPQDVPRLERNPMTLDIPNLKDYDQNLRDEANAPDLEVPQGEPTSKTQIIAIYGKGGIGKSFTLANLSHMMAEMGKRVLLIGCDPKSDTTSLLFGGKACPTIIETSAKKKLAGEEVKIGDVCFKRGGVFAMELGGPEVGRGCGGRGIIHGFELLEKLGFHDWDFDYVLLDFLGDVVCGGFRPADRARHGAKGHPRCLQRPAIALCRQQRLLGGGIFPQAGR